MNSIHMVLTAWIADIARLSESSGRFWRIRLVLILCCIAPNVLASTPTDNVHGPTSLTAANPTLPSDSLPEFKFIAAAKSNELTPSNHLPEPSKRRTWTVSHGDGAATRYSSLDQINRSNVSQLRQAWTYHSGDGVGNIQCNPIIVDGVMFAPTPGRALVAINAANGRELWRFQVERPQQLGLSDAPARRGLVYWPGDIRNPPRIVFASGNWIYALDPITGKLIEGFGENGRTSLPTGGTAAGVIWRGTYIVPGMTGDIFAFDLRTGEQLWRFHTIPRPGEFGADSWVGSGRDGANCWGGVALDEARGIVYAAIGAARPDFIGVDRHGDNLFSNCLVALDAATGRRLWHFQNIRHDIWDLDNPAPPNLVSIKREGRLVDAVAAVTKEGGTLLLDRVTGKPIFPFRLRRAPKSVLPGEATAEYQPYPLLPEPLSSPEFKLEDVTDRTVAAREYTLRQVARSNYGWFEPFTEGRPTLFRSSRGGAEWTGACIDVPTGRLYVSTNHLISVATVYRSDERPRVSNAEPSAGETAYLQSCAGCHGAERKGVGAVPPLIGLRHRMGDKEVLALLESGRGAMPPALHLSSSQRNEITDFLMGRDNATSEPATPNEAGPAYFAVGYRFINDDQGYPGSKPPWGRLNCLDLNTGKILWQVPLGEYEELSAQGVPVTGTENFGGPTVTAGGLVFCAGTKDARIRAFDKDTGDVLWSGNLPWVGSAPPSVYEVDGRQFIVIAATGGGKLGTPTGDAYVAFALPEQ